LLVGWLVWFGFVWFVYVRFGFLSLGVSTDGNFSASRRDVSS
jgi:hypothetical protein